MAIDEGAMHSRVKRMWWSGETLILRYVEVGEGSEQSLRPWSGVAVSEELGFWELGLIDFWGEEEEQ